MVKVTGAADCLPSGAFYQGHQNYVTKCASDNDESRINNLFDTAAFDNMIQQSKGIATDLVLSLKGLETTLAASKMTTSQLNDRVAELNKQKNDLTAQKNDIVRETENADKTFLDIITTEQPEAEHFPSLQDIALGLFVLGWIILGFTLVYIKTAGPNGNITTGAVVLLLFIFISVVVYSLMKITL